MSSTVYEICLARTEGSESLSCFDFLYHHGSQILTDVDSGFPYFYNVITGETSWEKPAEDEVKMKGWELVVDTTSSDGAVYYRNLATNITQWQMPEEMDTFDALESLTELNISHNRLTQIASVRLQWFDELRILILLRPNGLMAILVYC